MYVIQRPPISSQYIHFAATGGVLRSVCGRDRRRVLGEVRDGGKVMGLLSRLSGLR